MSWRGGRRETGREEGRREKTKKGEIGGRGEGGTSRTCIIFLCTRDATDVTRILLQWKLTLISDPTHLNSQHHTGAKKSQSQMEMDCVMQLHIKQRISQYQTMD